MKAENYIIKGKFFDPKPKDTELSNFLNNVKTIIINYFRNKGYVYHGPSDFLCNYFELDFYNFNTTNFKESKIKTFFGKSKTRQAQEYHMNSLKQTRDDIPSEMRVHLIPGKFKEIEGLFVEVISKTNRYFKIAQLNYDSDISKEKYSFIVAENQDIISSFAKANAYITVEEPKPLNLILDTRAGQLLRNYGFLKISTLLESGLKNLEIGNQKESISDLIGVIENFLFDLIEKLGEKPFGRENPEKNINVLCNKKWLSDSMRDRLKSSWYNLIYISLKDSDHKKENLDLFDLRLFFNITESIINYLLEKSWRYKITNQTEKKQLNTPETKD